MERLEFDVLLTFDSSVLVWAARGVNYDIAAQGKTIAEAKAAFQRVVIAQIVADVHDGKTPFEDCPAAPEHVHRAFEGAEQLKAEQRLTLPAGLALPPDYQISAQLHDMRISA